MYNKNDSYPYMVTVLLIVFISLGVTGNIAIVWVFGQAEQRSKAISHLMINLALSNILICVIGYPVAAVHGWKTGMKDHFYCTWYAFSNATTGIACILTLSFMTVTQYQVIAKITVPFNQQNRLNKKRIFLSIAAIWITAIILSIPPIFGWNRFVPVQTGFSCHPDWSSQDPADRAYIWFLVIGGFIIPLIVICVSYGMMYRSFKRLPVGQIKGNARDLRLAQQKKLNKMIIVAILAFLLSWSPYCIVCLISNFKGTHVIPSNVFSSIPPLMAKSSVVYNPIIIMYFNNSFRTTLKRMILREFGFLSNAYCCHRREQQQLQIAKSKNILTSLETTGANTIVTITAKDKKVSLESLGKVREQEEPINELTNGSRTTPVIQRTLHMSDIDISNPHNVSRPPRSTRNK